MGSLLGRLETPESPSLQRTAAAGVIVVIGHSLGGGHRSAMVVRTPPGFLTHWEMR